MSRLPPLRSLAGALPGSALRVLLEVEDFADAALDGVLAPARRTRVVRLADWALPPPPTRLEILHRAPRRRSTRPPILFVHGFHTGAWVWQSWLEGAAAAGWPAYAVSLRGHGGSPLPERGGPPLLRDYVFDVLQAIATLPEPPVLVGHSMGALVTQYALERYPAARAGVLVAPVAADTGAGTVLRMAVQRPTAVPAMLLGRRVDLDLDMMVTAAADEVATRRLQEHSVGLPTLARYQVLLHQRPRLQRCPLLLLASPDDRMVGFRDALRTARAYGADLREYPGMAHGLMLDAGSDVVLTEMLEWLSDQVGVRRARRTGRVRPSTVADPGHPGTPTLGGGPGDSG